MYSIAGRFGETLLSGKELIEETSRIALASIPNPVTLEDVRAVTVEAYNLSEGFDGESTNPKWFAKKVVERMRWKGLI